MTATKYKEECYHCGKRFPPSKNACTHCGAEHDGEHWERSFNQSTIRKTMNGALPEDENVEEDAVEDEEVEVEDEE